MRLSFVRFIYGSCQTICEFRWHVDRPLVDGTRLTARETAALIHGGGQSAFLPRFFGTDVCWRGQRLGSPMGHILWATGLGELHAAPKSIAAFAQADFVLAMGLFAAAALISAQARRALTAVVAVSWVLLVCAAMRPLYFPDALDSLYFLDSKTLGLGLDVACRLIAAGAAIQLVRYRFGRIGLGPFLFGAGLLTLNLYWPPFTSHIPSEGYLLAEVLFGSSILLVVLDDSRLRYAPAGGPERIDGHHCAQPESRPDDADCAGEIESRCGGEGSVVPVDGKRPSGANPARRPVAGISASPGANGDGANWHG